MPTTSSRQQLDEGTKKTDKPKSPVIPATTTSSLKEQVDEAGGSSTKSKNHYFPDLKEVRSLNNSQYSGKDYMQKVRTVTMRKLHEEANRCIATEQLIVIPLEEDILGVEREALMSWDMLAIWAGLDQIDVQHLFVWIKILKLRVILEKKIPSDQYGFLCPYVLSLFILEFSFEDRVDYIAQQLATTKKLIFAPYNEKG
ncbi:uncharacterized protein LOC141619031 [Silene latifolia]|uniref:uncharacterized protein LOC141619031 n=1 Tax=Silene latifolia TaxID=37657 RepID=UPI003D782603